MPTSVNEWLPVVAAIASVLSALIVWGFASGKFVQRQSDEVEDMRRRHGALAERVTVNEGRISDGDKARHAFIDKVNAELGRLRHRYELIQQRMTIDEKHSDERKERMEMRLARIEGQLNDLQRQIDLLRAQDDPPERRRR